MTLKLTLFSIAVSFASSNALAQSAPKVVTIDGAQAQQIFDGMNGSPHTQWVENSIEVTILSNGNVTCTLMGSHGGSARANNPSYSCDISL